MLFKKAILFNSIPNKNRNEKYIEFFINPTSSEWKSCITDKAEYGFTVAIRAMLLKDGTVYCWPGTILHDTAVKKYGIPDGIHIEINNPNHIDIDQDYPQTFEYIYNAFKNTTTLYNYVNDNANVEWYFALDTILPNIDEDEREDYLNKHGIVFNRDSLKIPDIVRLYEKINSVIASKIKRLKKRS